MKRLCINPWTKCAHSEYQDQAIGIMCIQHKRSQLRMILLIVSIVVENYLAGSMKIYLDRINENIPWQDQWKYTLTGSMKTYLDRINVNIPWPDQWKYTLTGSMKIYLDRINENIPWRDQWKYTLTGSMKIYLDRINENDLVLNY